MIRREFEAAQLKNAVMVTTILWASMLLTPVILGFVAYMQSSSWEGAEATAFPEFFPALLYAAAGAAILASLALRRVLLDPQRLVREPRLGQQQIQTLGEAQPESQQEYRLLYALGRYIVGLMIGCALVDAAGILGFVLTLLLHDLVHVVRLGVLSVVILVVFHRPNRTAMEDVASVVKRTGY